MSARDNYQVSFRASSQTSPEDNIELLDNEIEFNANQFKLFDDFTTDLRVNYSMRHQFGELQLTSRLRGKGPDPDDSGVDMENGNPMLDGDTSKDSDLLENEVMVDPWSSMDSSNSPLTDSGPSASEDCTPSTSSDAPLGAQNASSTPFPDAHGLPPSARRLPPEPKQDKPENTRNISHKSTDRTRSRDLRLQLETEAEVRSRRPHFLDEDYHLPSKSNIECRIPKPHFLDSPSPDEVDERSDITNPNFLDDIDGDDVTQKTAGTLPKRPTKVQSSYSNQEHRPYHTDFRSTLQYRLENTVRSSEREKRTSQLYTGTWPGDRDLWIGQDSASVRSFSSNGSADGMRPSSNLENKMECVCSLISLLTLSPENNADLSGPLLEMSRSVESCIAMRQAGCIPLLVQLIHSKVPRETRDRAAKALRNIIHTQTDDKAGRREARVWKLLEQVREYCYVLEDVVEARKEGKDIIEDDTTKHPSQSVAALMKLSFDEEHRHVVCQLGGLQALAALVSGDQAAHGSRTDDNTCLTMRKYAGMTLTNLTFGDGNNKSLLCSFKDFMLALVEQLESPNDDMRQVTAAVLRNLSWRADTSSKQVLREVGAVKGLTKAAMTCQKEATLKSVLSALWNLTAHCSMNKVALCSVDGALGFLVDMLSYDSPSKTLAIVENAGGIMRNVSSHIAVREDYRQILRERNCLSVLLQHLKSPSLTVVSNSCGTLWNLSARCPQDQQFLWDHGAVPMLRSLIHSKHKMIAMGSGAALKNLLNSKPGKSHIIALDTTARNMNLPALPTLGARKQKLEQELDQNLAETCDNIEPATSPTTSNRDEKNLFTATERHIAMNLERHRMTSSSPLMGTLTSQISLSHSAHLASYLSCSNTLLKGGLVTRSSNGSANNVNRSDSKDSVTSTHSDSVFERVMRTGKVPVPTPRSKDLMKTEPTGEAAKIPSNLPQKDAFIQYSSQPPIPPPRTSTDMRTNYTESGYDVDTDSCDQPIDYSRKYSETKAAEPGPAPGKQKPVAKKFGKKENAGFGDYQETDLDQPTDYSLRYTEYQSGSESDAASPAAREAHEDCVKHFATEGTPYETPVVFSTATSMSDLRVIGARPRPPPAKHNVEAMSHSDEKDTCSLEEAARPDNERPPSPGSLGSPAGPERPVRYAEEGTPACFSRVSSLSSLAEGDADADARRPAPRSHAPAAPAPHPPAYTPLTPLKDREGLKAVTFAPGTPPAGTPPPSTPPTAPLSPGSPPLPNKSVEDTPLMFSRSSSLGSLPDCGPSQDHATPVSEISRLTSGCISPSDIPDSPGQSMPPSPTTRAKRRRDHAASVGTSACATRCGSAGDSLSAATSLSSLTLLVEPQQRIRLISKAPLDGPPATGARPLLTDNANRQAVRDLTNHSNEPMKNGSGGDSCRVYCTEDTPALSKAGSHSDLSALSLLSGASGASGASVRATAAAAAGDHSDSSTLSDGGDLLEQCIQRGIDEVVKHKGSASDCALPFARDDVTYLSPPPAPALPCPPRPAPPAPAEPASPPSTASPPPLPPRAAAATYATAAAAAATSLGTQGRKHESRVPVRAGRGPRGGSARGDDEPGAGSLSSLSLESFGSSDREIFEATVAAGLRARAPRAQSAERAPPAPRAARRPPRSLDRCAPAARTRSASLSSLSNDSFGSTDKEVFERCVRAGMRPAPAAPAPPARHALQRLAPRDQALLQHVIARGAAPAPAKNPQGPVAERAPAAGPPARPAPPALRARAARASNEDLAAPDAADLAAADVDTSGDLDRSNESYADVAEETASDLDRSFELFASTAALLPALPEPPVLPDVVSRSAGPAGAGTAPDLTARLQPPPPLLPLDALLTSALEREAARLAAALCPPPASPPPASLLELVRPPSAMDDSLLSAPSLEPERLVFQLQQPEPALTLLDQDPPSLFHELLDSTLDLDVGPPGPDLEPEPEPELEPEPEPSCEDGSLPGGSSVDSSPRRRDPARLTPRQRRLAAGDRYRTYTIATPPAAPEPATLAPRRRLSARQRRAEDRSRYQTQTVQAPLVPTPTAPAPLPAPAPQPAPTARERRQQDAARYRTRTVSLDTTGYDSLSSEEPAPAAPTPPRPAPAPAPDSGLEDDDLCARNNRRNTALTAALAAAACDDAHADVSGETTTSDLVITEVNSAVAPDTCISDSEPPDLEVPVPLLTKPKPKIVTPTIFSAKATSSSQLEEAARGVRGRKKAYVSPYRRVAPGNPPARAGPAPRAVAASVTPAPPRRQRTFTKEESSVPAARLPAAPAPTAPAPALSASSSQHSLRAAAGKAAGASRTAAGAPAPPRLARSSTFAARPATARTSHIPAPRATRPAARAAPPRAPLSAGAKRPAPAPARPHAPRAALASRGSLAPPAPRVFARKHLNGQTA